jgi:hypothetical protein
MKNSCFKCREVDASQHDKANLTNATGQNNMGKLYMESNVLFPASQLITQRGSENAKMNGAFSGGVNSD